MAIFGTLSVFVRNIDVSSGELAFYRAALASLLLGVYLALTKNKISISVLKKDVLLLLISGAFMGINWILLFEAYKYTTVSVATLSYYFAPCLVTLLCPVLFKEKYTLKQCICFVMSTLGVVLVIGPEFSGGNNPKGILFGLGAALFYASVVLLNKFIKNVEGIHRTFIQFVAACVVLAPYVFLTTGVTFMTLDTTGIINLLVVGLVHTGFTYCLYFSAIKKLSGQQVSLLSYIDPLVAVVVSVTLLRERVTLLQVAGGIFILGFALINEINFKRKW